MDNVQRINELKVKTLDYPKTLEEAKNYRYGEWAGNPKGIGYKEGFCAYEIPDGWLYRQCSLKNGKGINGLYCGIHAKKVNNK